MSRRMEIELEGVKVIATFLEKEAPQTCDAIWKILPIETEAKHCMTSGQCVWAYADDLPFLERENHSPFVSQGDLIVIPECTPPGEIMIIYGRKSFLISSRTGISPANHYAIVRDLDQMEKFAEKAANLINVGAKKIRFRKFV